jgi:hypothetical protein
MRVVTVMLAISTALAPLPAGAELPCLVCAPSVSAEERPLSIDIMASLDFARVAATASGGGSAAIDPATREQRLAGNAVALGGYPVAGEVVVRGTPGRAVRIDLPAEARLSTAAGGSVALVDLSTDLPPAPRLDAAGVLRFRFGGRLLIGPGANGHFRGRIPITASYI